MTTMHNEEVLVSWHISSCIVVVVVVIFGDVELYSADKILCFA